jgi:hypothetical protein
VRAGCVSGASCEPWAVPGEPGEDPAARVGEHEAAMKMWWSR